MTDSTMLVGYKQPDLDAPSPRTPAWLWIVTLMLLGVVVAIQQLGQEPPPTRADREAAAAGVTVEPPGVNMLVMFGKMMLFVKENSPAQTAEFMRVIEDQAGVGKRPIAEVEVPSPIPPPGGDDEPEVVRIPLPLEPSADGEDAAADDAARDPDTAQRPPPAAAGAAPRSPPPPPAVSRFRVALLEAEAYGPPPAVERMTALLRDLDPESPLHEDIATALIVYRDGPDAVDSDAADALVERHGWFGRLLLSYGEPPTEPFRAATLQSALWAFIFLATVGFGVIFALLSGMVILIIGMVFGFSGKLRASMPLHRTGGRLWLETFAVFVAGFLLVQVGVSLLTAGAPDDADWPVWVRLGAQWSLALLVFWPLLRGMSFERFRGEVGWHRGRGFFREVGAGVLAYLAALPVYVGVAAILVSIMLLYRHYAGVEDPPPLPENRLTELLDRGPGVVLLLASLVVLWAPLVEETIFRGALYRAVRSPLGFTGAALLTASMFAVMHAYAAVQLILVGTLGLVFAFMREWRGSLLPSITAHCLHNGMVLTVMIVMIQLARG